MAFCSCILIILFFKCHCQAAVITVPPVSVTVRPFKVATFTCEGTGDILSWWVQSAVLTDSIKQQRQITVTTTNTSNTNFSSVLTVNAIPINADLGIGCEVITISPFERVISSGALTIRGVSRVEDIQYTFPTNNSLLITWSHPVYYSNDVPVGSLLSYQVLVIDEEDRDIILNTNTPHTNIAVPNITECDTFNISVTALVDQYKSIDNNTDIKNNGSYNATITTSEDNFLIPNVSIELSCSPSKCNTSLTITSGSEVIDQYTINGTDETINDIRTLIPSHQYNYTVRVFSLRNKLQYETYTIITTYQVIDLYINNTYTNGSVSVQCVYELLSTADGCHVIFTDTSNGRNEYFNITGSVTETLLLPSGNYAVTSYDIVNGSLYGPAFQYPTAVEIVKVIPPTSTSSIVISESTAPQSTVGTHTASPTITVTVGTETTSSTSGTINDTNNYIVPVVAGTVSVIVLVILIILAICVGMITVNKRKKMKVQVFIRSEIATCQQPQAETNQYQEVHELMNEVPIARSSVLYIPIHEENPYHVTRNEFLHDNDTTPSHNAEGSITQWEQRPSLTSTATQDTILEDRISLTTSNDIHDNAYTLEPAVTVNVNNDTVSMTATNTAVTAAPTYAVVAKRTDATAIPNVDQRVVYDQVTGDINKKRGDVTVYPSNGISTLPPPPSYADTVAQEHSAIVSSSQFKVPVQVTDAAEQDDYPPANIEDDHDIDTPAEIDTYSTDIVQPRAASIPSNEDEADGRTGGPIIDESPMNGGQVLPIPFQETASIAFACIKKSLVVDNGYITDEMLRLVKWNLDETPKPRIEVVPEHEENNSIVFEDTSDHENHEVPEVVPSRHNEVHLFRYLCLVS